LEIGKTASLMEMVLKSYLTEQSTLETGSTVEQVATALKSFPTRPCTTVSGKMENSSMANAPTLTGKYTRANGRTVSPMATELKLGPMAESMKESGGMPSLWVWARKCTQMARRSRVTGMEASSSRATRHLASYRNLRNRMKKRLEKHLNLWERTTPIIP